MKKNAPHNQNFDATFSSDVQSSIKHNGDGTTTLELPLNYLLHARKNGTLVVLGSLFGEAFPFIFAWSRLQYFGVTRACLMCFIT